jgi:polygalacturonase
MFSQIVSKYRLAVFCFWPVLALQVQAVNPALPVIPSAVFNVTNYGAVGDGVTDNTIAIQNTINACNAAGGGIVEIPAGTFLSGPITLTNNLDFNVDGLLQMLPLYTYPGGVTNAQTFIYCNGVHDLAMSGSGVIDGQGAAWWAYNTTNNTIVRPMLIDLHNVNRLYIHDITFQNPANHCSGVRDASGNVTISNLTINTVSPSPNTDGIDYTATNGIIENSFISDGDDNLAIGSTGPVIGLLITNCFFGFGHGVSTLGPTAPMSDMTVINCAFRNTSNGIRWKCLRGSSAPVQNINYYNLTMTNVGLPIVIYSYYDETGTPDRITPSTVLAASNTVPITATTPVWRDITISNLIVVTTNDIGGVVWGPGENAISNLTLINITNTAPKTFDLYNVKGVNIINSRFNFNSGTTFTLCNAGVTLSNTTAAGKAVTIGGAASANSLALYGTPASMTSTDLFAAIPLALSGCVLTNTGNLVLGSSNALNFTLGTSVSKLAVVGNLTLGGTFNFSAGSGFTNGVFTIISYSGALAGSLPVVGAIVPGYSCTLNTSTGGLVNVVATYTGVFPSNTTSSVTSSANPSTDGARVTFAATVTPAPTNGEVITFYDGFTTLGTGALSAGQATFSTTELTPGTHLITTVYAGDRGFLASTSPALAQTVNAPPGTVFSDTFGASTVGSATPGQPTLFGTSYEVLSGKSQVPTPAINSSGMVFGIGATGSGVIEVQALFTTNPVALYATGDFVQLQVTFTATAGILSQSGNWDFGLYNSGGGSLPVAGGLNGSLSTGSSTAATGGTQLWEGYVAQIGYAGSSATSDFYDRQPQSAGTANNDQDLVTTSTSSSYNSPGANPIGVASTGPSTVLTVGDQYSEILNYTLTSSNALQLQSQLYAGTGTTGAVMSAMSAVTSTTPLTNSFDGLAFGWRATGSTPSEMTVNSIIVTGQSSPPIISSAASGSQLTLTWPGNYQGWLLQSNSTGLDSGNWITIPGTDGATNYSFTVSPSAPNTFYRLIK